MDDASVNDITRKLDEMNINVSDISLEVSVFDLLQVLMLFHGAPFMKFFKK